MPRAGLTTAAVVDAAGDVADAEGLDALTLSSIAARFGVAVPSLYKHVGGLADLQRRLAATATRELGQSLSRASVGRAGLDALVAMTAAYRTYATRNPGRYAATVRAANADDADHTAASDAALETVLAVLAGYGLTGTDAIDAARTLRSALHGFVTLEAGGGFGLPRDVDRSFDRMVAALDTALAGWVTHAGDAG